MRYSPRGPTRRMVLSGFACAVASKRLIAQPFDALRPERFGARGDGHSDDTAAFQALGRALAALRGGTVTLTAGAVYRVGRQQRGRDGKGWGGEPILSMKDLSSVEIFGNGATLKLNDGLLYGSFDPSTAQRYDPPAGNFSKLAFAADLGAIIDISACRSVRISDIILDGNASALSLGGHWGDVGIQLHAVGLRLLDVGDVTVERVEAINNGLDGIYLRGVGRAANSPLDRIDLTDVICRRNGRQGVSVVAGAGITFTRCSFVETGQGTIFSRPGAGVDIEPNGRAFASRLRFENCTFINNRGVGLLADQGNSHSIGVHGCTFWQGFAARPGMSKGSGDALWLVKPGVAIVDCAIHGTVTNLASDAKVERCQFDDAVHPRLGRAAQTRRYLLDGAGGTFTSSTLTVTGSGRQALIYAAKPILLRRCTLRYGGVGADPSQPALAVAWFGRSATLEDVTFVETIPTRSKGRFYIYDGKPATLGRVVVPGPRIRWGSNPGRVGNVAAIQR